MNVRRYAGAALAAAALASLTVVAVPSAQATSRYGCDWPYVCFYATESSTTPVAKYKDLGEQPLSETAQRALKVYNSRNDDRVKLWMFNQYWECVNPNQAKATWSGKTTPHGINWPMKIKIEDAAKC
ncbi:hypothetical protein [Kitasatospora herbaricolor]|jgi:hypothetical protein|uniref:Peptidase inhibitor family I36 n=1 Tax=Kitasatospora herbaricolor TaxID=68217 RepID=A0ABZ1WJY5_9ACTN|nr:hypothetical protein [Kitasatospora herbaricolor]